MIGASEMVLWNHAFPLSVRIDCFGRDGCRSIYPSFMRQIVVLSVACLLEFPSLEFSLSELWASSSNLEHTWCHIASSDYVKGFLEPPW